MKCTHKKKTYGVDLDGVLCSFITSFVAWLNNNLNTDIKEEDIKSYYWYEDKNNKITKEEFFREFDRFGIEGHGYRNLELLPYAKKTLRRINDAGHKIHYITSRPAYALQDTIDYFEEHKFPQRENLHFVEGPKSKFNKKLNVDVFIDDSPTILEDITTNTRATIYCMDYLYNRHLNDSLGYYTRVSGLDEFLMKEGL